MSEIKGQLLGIVLVVAVFGVVGGVLVTAFSKSAKNIGAKIETDAQPVDSSAKTDVSDSIISTNDLLTF